MIESPRRGSVTAVGAASLRDWAGRRQPGGSGLAATRRRLRCIGEELPREAGRLDGRGLSMRVVAETLV
jgi:hypothetical protein